MTSDDGARHQSSGGRDRAAVAVPYVVCAIWVAREGEEERVAAALRRLIGPSREEPGNLIYQLHRDPMDRRRFLAYEQYVDRSAYDAHLSSPYFRRYGLEEAIPSLERRDLSFFETWEGESRGEK